MMKKVLLLNLFSLAILSMFAQTQVGYTTYDLQTNNSNCRRVATNAAGEVVITYTRDHTNSEAAPDRGTGYNYKNAGGVWSETSFPLPSSPFVREDVGRTGWSNIGFFGNKEITVAHFADDVNSFGGLQVQQRDLGSGSAWSTVQLNSNNINGTYSDDATWPRIAISGDSIFVISSVQIGTFVNGVDGGIYSHRSLDGGATWTESVIPFINGNNFVAIGADAYAIDANDNGVIAIVVGRYNAFMLKSTDFGATWTTTTMIQTVDINGVDNAINYSGADGETAVNQNISDESYSVVVDDEGDVHVWMGRLNYQKEDPFQEGSVFPFQGGLMYWNETMDEPILMHATRFTVEAGADCTPSFSNVYETDQDFTQFGLYSSSIVSQPSGGYDENGKLAVAYTRFRTQILDINGNATNVTTDGFMYKEVYLMSSSDNGATWDGPVNVSQMENMECAYPGVPRKFYNDVVPVIWQQDERPGNALQVPAGYSHNFGDNLIMYSDINVASVATPLDETCPEIALLDVNVNTVIAFTGCNPSQEELNAILFIDDVPQGPDVSMVRSATTLPNPTPPGTYNVDIYLEDNAGNLSADTVSIILEVVADNVPPTFSFIGPDTLQVVTLTPYTDPGIIYDDNGCFPTLAPTITDNVNTPLVAGAPGLYTYVYDIEDNSGNVTTATRYVEVIGSDNTPPAITLNGMASVTIEACTAYDELDATAFDLVDFAVPVTINSSSLDINVVGTYNVLYIAQDNSTNIDTVIRVVNVVDNTAPVLTILDDNDLLTPADSYTEGGINYTYEGTAFVSPANSASDPNCSGQGVTITIDDSDVEASISGNYIVDYLAVDENNQSTSQTLTVRVGKEPTPVFTLTPGSNTVTVMNSSTDNPITYEWDFGNGESSNQANSQAGRPFYSSSDPTYPNYEVCLTVTNRFNGAPFNKTEKVSCQTITITGIADRSVLDAAVSIYPNPSNGLLNVAISETNATNLTVEVTNILGTVIASQEITKVSNNELVQFDLEGNAAGIYIVNISTENASTSKKVVIK